jgi:hypothetical protein
MIEQARPKIAGDSIGRRNGQHASGHFVETN